MITSIFIKKMMNYLNKIFSFNDEQNEDEKEQIYHFPFPFCDFEEDKKNNYFNNNLSEELKMNKDKYNDIFIIKNWNNNHINSIITNNNKNNDNGEEIMEKIANYISNYQDILLSQIAVKSPNHFDLDKYKISREYSPREYYKFYEKRRTSY